MNQWTTIAFKIKSITLMIVASISISAKAQTDTSYLSLERFLVHRLWIEEDCKVDTCDPYYIQDGFFRRGDEKNEMCFHWRYIFFIANPLTGKDELKISGCNPMICVSRSAIEKGKRTYYIENTSEAGVYKNKIVICSDSSFTMEGPHGMPWIKKNKFGFKATNKVAAEARYLFTEYLNE